MKRKIDWQNHLLNFFGVILGVYLAFLMNEWAQQRADRNERDLLKQSLITDLRSDIDTYENYQIPVNERQMEQIDSLLIFLAEEDMDGVIARLDAILQVENYVPTSITYTSMKSSGKLNLIDDLTVQKELTDFYEILVNESVRKSEFQVEYFSNEILHWLTEHADLMNSEINTDADLVVFRNKVQFYHSFIYLKTESYRMIVDRSKELITLLE